MCLNSGVAWLAAAQHHSGRRCPDVQLAAVLRHRLAVDASALPRVPWPRENETARRRPRGLDLQYDAPALLAKRITERPVRRAQSIDFDSRPVEPSFRDPGTEHQRVIGDSLVGKQIEGGTNEVRGDPAV